jgi:hypothetical protein
MAGAHWVGQEERDARARHSWVRPLNFVWSFTLPSNATNIHGTLRITADNAYRVSLGGVRVGKDGVLDRHGDDPSWTTIETFGIDPVPGSNTITIRAVNYRSTGSPYDNHRRDPFQSRHHVRFLEASWSAVAPIRAEGGFPGFHRPRRLGPEPSHLY